MTTKFNRKLLSLAVCAASVGLSPGVVNAQEEADIAIAEEIIVRGIRSSLESAQEIKRNADTVMDVITASDIGALPDKSVTEALQRVPGVTIERFASSTDPNHFAAEGRGVVVRGLDRVRSEFNGRDSFSANTAGGLNYEDIPPELLGSVQVVKNQTADLIAGGVAGTVNLVTRKPFDSAGRTIFFSAKGSYGDLVGDISPAFSGLFSDRWETGIGEFGFLISLSTSEFKARGDGINIENFYERSQNQTEFDFEGSTALDAFPDQTLYMTHGAQVRTSDSDRDRTGVTASLQWQNPDESIVATAEYIRSSSHETWRERVIMRGIQGFWPFRDGANVQFLNDGADATFDSNNFFTSGSVEYTGPDYRASSRTRSVDNTIEDYSFHLMFRPNDNLQLDFDVQRLEATSDVYDNSVTNAFASSDMHIDLRGSTPRVRFLNDDITSPSTDTAYYMASIMDTNVMAEGTLNAFRADLSYEMDAGWFRGVSTGLYYSDREQDIRDDDFANWGGVSASWGGVVHPDYQGLPPEEIPSDKTGVLTGYVDRPELFEEFTFPSNFFGGDGLVGDNRSFLFPRMSDATNVNALDDYLFDNYLVNAGRVRLTDRPGADSDGFLPHERHITGEERQEAYVRFDFENDALAMPVRSNLGLRYVRYQVESTGSSRFLRVLAEGSAFQPALEETYPDVPLFFDGTGTPAQTHKADAYSTVLPSLNVSVGVTDDVILRLAASKALYFPQLRDLRNTGTYRGAVSTSWLYDDLSETTASWACDTWTDPEVPRCNEPSGVSNLGTAGYRGNPDLKPEESNQVDLTAEWYFAPVGSLTLSLFHKRISNLFREQNFMETVTRPDGVSRNMSVRMPTNEGTGTIQGFELAYQQMYDFLPGIWSGLGLQLNYTYIDQKDLNDRRGEIPTERPDLSPDGDTRNTFRNFTNLGLPGYSDQTYNIVGIYEAHGISARLAYNWRSKYLLARRDADSFSAIYANASGHLDGSIFYDITDNIKIGLEASNLLNTRIETTTQFNQEGLQTPKSYFLTDRRYALVLRGSF